MLVKNKCGAFPSVAVGTIITDRPHRTEPHKRHDRLRLPESARHFGDSSVDESVLNGTLLLLAV